MFIILVNAKWSTFNGGDMIFCANMKQKRQTKGHTVTILYRTNTFLTYFMENDLYRMNFVYSTHAWERRENQIKLDTHRRDILHQNCFQFYDLSHLYGMFTTMKYVVDVIMANVPQNSNK